MQVLSDPTHDTHYKDQGKNVYVSKHEIITLLVELINSLTQMKNFRLFPNQEFAYDNFQSDENNEVLLKGRKGETACYLQFSFSHIVFKRLLLQTGNNKGLFGKKLSIVSV